MPDFQVCVTSIGWLLGQLWVTENWSELSKVNKIRHLIALE